MEHDRLVRTVTAAQKGDSEALNELFNAYYNDVYYFALKTVKDEELACDITQETFVEIINTLGNLQAPGAFVTWMKQIAYHQCTRYFKKKKDVLVDEDEEGNSIFDTLAEERAEFIPDEAMDQADFRQTILNMIDALSEEQRSAVMMLYFDELSVKQIAEIQGVSEGTVKSRLNYARKAIKSSVEDYEKKNGIKLHSFGVLPLLLWLFQDTVAAMPAASAVSVAAGVTAATGTAVAVGATSAAATAATTATATVVAATAAKAAGIPLAAKIAAGIMAAAVTVGGAAVGISTLTDTDPTEPSESYVTEASLPSDPAPAAWVVPEGCTYARGNIVYQAGDPAPTDCRLGDMFTDGTYEYLYRSVTIEDEGVPNGKTTTVGWNPVVLDKSASAYAPIRATINNEPITMVTGTFAKCINMTAAPEIPDTVTYMQSAFLGCISLTAAPELPDGVWNMDRAFCDCATLGAAPKIPAAMLYMSSAFEGCTALTTPSAFPEGVRDISSAYRATAITYGVTVPVSVYNAAYVYAYCANLTGKIEINAPLSPIDNYTDPLTLFVGTKAPILVTGSCPRLDALADRYSNVTVLGAPTEEIPPEEVPPEEEPAGWVVPAGCTYTRGDTVYTAGQVMDLACQEGDQFNDGTYIYTYTDGICYPTEALEYMYIIVSWNPVVIDTTATEYAPIAASINGEPVRMMKQTFKNCKNLLASPQIPGTVVFMSETYRGCTSLTAAPAIPGVTDYMVYVFADCTALVTPSTFPKSLRVATGAYMNTAISYGPALPETVIMAPYIFNGCQNLTGEVAIHGQLMDDGKGQNAFSLFDGTVLPITLTGSSSQLAEIAAKYENVTVK